MVVRGVQKVCAEGARRSKYESKRAATAVKVVATMSSPTFYTRSALGVLTMGSQPIRFR